MYQNQIMRFARALFDNVAEMPRELSFKKGDILTVCQDEYESSPEWWVCSLRNMIGLAPANRLEAMPILIESSTQLQKQMSASLYDELPDQIRPDNTYSNFNDINRKNSKINEEYSIYQLPNEDVYVNPVNDKTLLTVKSTDEHSVYQIPVENNSSNTYFNIPESPATATYSNIGPDVESYFNLNTKLNEYHNNRSDYSDSFSDTTSTSFSDTVGSSLNSFHQLSISSSDSGDIRSLPISNSIPLKMSADNAVSKYRSYHSETTAACNKVIEFVKAKWKSEEMLKITIKSIKTSFVDFHQNLLVLCNFSNCILENSKLCGDKNLTKKIWKHLQPIQEAIVTTKDSLEKLETMNWSPDKIAIAVRLAVREGADCLSHVVSAARNVLIQVRSLSVTICGNSNILFPEFSVETGSKNNEFSIISPMRSEESTSDKNNLLEVMRLFANQVTSQIDHVNDTVDDFIKILSLPTRNMILKETVISHSKFVVRSATQLVCIAKNLTDAQNKNFPIQKIEQEGNNLCNSLKIMVNTTKELLINPDFSSESFSPLIGLLKSIKSNARNLQSIVADSVTII